MINILRRSAFLFTLIILAPFVVFAQMVSPSIDSASFHGEPFSYFSKPTDELGVKDGTNGTMITPDGYIGTGFGTMMFFYGKHLKPVSHRIRSLKKGYLPIDEYSFTRNGISYRVTAFAATLDGKSGSPLMNFVRVQIDNKSSEPKNAQWAVGVRYANILTQRNRLPVKASEPGKYEQAGAPFNANWDYKFSGKELLRDGKVFYMLPETPKPKRLSVFNANKENMKVMTPDTPTGIAEYSFRLSPHGKEILDFKMPFQPVAQNSTLAQQLRKASFNDYMNRTSQSWDKIINRGIEITVPEAKVNNTFKTSLIYDLIARDKEGDNYIQKVNEFQYHAFWIRDASFIVRMYDISGYHKIAKQALDFFARWQKPNGNFISQPGEYDGWGQTMWAYGQHYRLTHDEAFAKKVLPSIRRAVNWLIHVRAQDSLHLLPPVILGDNEGINGRITGQDFWALAGLRNITAMARERGDNSDADLFQKEYDGFYKTVYARLRKVTRNTHGYIPPALDKYGGDDWGNMLGIYPAILLKPDDPMVTATLLNTRNKYKEGLMTYGVDGVRYLHHYLTMRNTETELIRNEQEMAIKDLYAILVHTGSTNAGFEFEVTPWGSRDPRWDLAPHGWFAADYRILIRNMMVREQGDELHLFSAVSPDWIQPGDSIRVLRAPTNFGQVNMVLHCHHGSADLTMNNHFQGNGPKDLVINMPWFMRVTKVTADGHAVSINKKRVTLPAGTRRVHIMWRRESGTQNLSFKKAAENYIRSYRQHYEEMFPGKSAGNSRP